MSKNVTLTATNINLGLFREQRNALIEMQVTQDTYGIDMLEGVINTMCNMIDNYENAFGEKRKAPSGASGTLTGRIEEQLELDLGGPKTRKLLNAALEREQKVKAAIAGTDRIISDGSTASYYELPKGATELQDLISYINANSQIGEILRACMRYGKCNHSDKLRDIKKICYYAQAEKERLLKYER